MAINKNFVIKNGVEVNTDLLVGDSTLNKVGIATTVPGYTLHIGVGAGDRGGIGATDLTVTGVATIGTQNSTSGALNVGGISTFSGDIFEFQLIKYYVGGNYNWHCDYGVAPMKGSVRKLSMSVHLTDPREYEGGELNLINYSNYPITANNDLGSTIIFDSKLPHKVWPVTWGTRIALVGWANGPKLR